MDAGKSSWQSVYLTRAAVYLYLPLYNALESDYNIMYMSDN